MNFYERGYGDALEDLVRDLGAIVDMGATLDQVLDYIEAKAALARHRTKGQGF